MSPSVKSLLRIATSSVLLAEDATIYALKLNERVPYILRLVAKIVKPPENVPTNFTPPTDAEIEAEIRQQLVDTALGALQL